MYLNPTPPTMSTNTYAHVNIRKTDNGYLIEINQNSYVFATLAECFEQLKINTGWHT